jgi:hypothetical protein
MWRIDNDQCEVSYSSQGGHSYGNALQVNLTPIPQTANCHHLNPVIWFPWGWNYVWHNLKMLKPFPKTQMLQPRYTREVQRVGVATKIMRNLVCKYCWFYYNPDINSGIAIPQVLTDQTSRLVWIQQLLNQKFLVAWK